MAKMNIMLPLIAIIALAAGIGGILIYRNNQKSIEKDVSTVEKAGSDVKSVATAMKKL